MLTVNSFLKPELNIEMIQFIYECLRLQKYFVISKDTFAYIEFSNILNAFWYNISFILCIT